MVKSGNNITCSVTAIIPTYVKYAWGNLESNGLVFHLN